MSKFTQAIKPRWCWPVMALLVFGMSGCDASMSVMNPQGPAAARITALWWFLLAAGGAVFAVVMGLLGIALFRRRHAGHSAPQHHPCHRPSMVVGSALSTPGGVCRQ